MAYYDSIYNDQELSHRAKAVYIYLKDHANKEGICWPGIKTIAAGVSISRSTVKRALDDLVKQGWWRSPAGGGEMGACPPTSIN